MGASLTVPLPEWTLFGQYVADGWAGAWEDEVRRIRQESLRTVVGYLTRSGLRAVVRTSRRVSLWRKFLVRNGMYNTFQLPVPAA